MSHQYGSQITAAVNEVMLHKLKELTYRQFKEIAKAVIDENLPGWRQVLYLYFFSVHFSTETYFILRAGHISSVKRSVYSSTK